MHNVAEVGQYRLRKILPLRDVCVDAGVPSAHAMTSTEVVVEEDRVAGGPALDIKVDDAIAEYAGIHSPRSSWGAIDNIKQCPDIKRVTFNFR